MSGSMDVPAVDRVEIGANGGKGAGKRGCVRETEEREDAAHGRSPDTLSM